MDKKFKVFKIVELIISIVCLAIHCTTNYYYTISFRIMICGTFFGYVIILLGLCLVILMDKELEKILNLFYTFVGCIFFIVSGALATDTWSNHRTDYHDRKTLGVIEGILGIVNGIVFLADGAMQFKDR